MTKQDAAEIIITESAVFGQISVPVEQCLTFEQGLLGFPPQQRFAILPAAPDGVFWLQGVDDGSLVFLVVDPSVFVDGYTFDESSIEGPAPVIDEDSECAALCIVTLPARPDEPATANVQGPVFIDFTSQKGWQLILKDARFGTRYPINLSLPTDDNSSSSDGNHR